MVPKGVEVEEQGIRRVLGTDFLWNDKRKVRTWTKTT